MAKKGADTLSTMPPWLRALLDPDSLERHREKQIQAHAALQEKLREQRMQGSSSPDNELFALKQVLRGEFITDRFKPGSELAWIQAVKSIALLDNDPAHDNTNAILLALQNKDPDEITVDQVVLDQTKDQKKLPKREVNEIFIDLVLATLQKSESKSLIINLNNPLNESAPLAIVLLQGENGSFWLRDAKYNATIPIKTQDPNQFKTFLLDHIQQCHAGFNTATMTQVFNKELGLKQEQKTDVDNTRKQAYTENRELQKKQQASLSEKTEKPPSPSSPPSPHADDPNPTKPTIKSKT